MDPEVWISGEWDVSEEIAFTHILIRDYSRGECKW